MVRIEQVNFNYHKKENLFENLSLQIGKSRICGLLGKNGAGKSTLLKLITGVLFAKDGAITVEDRKVDRREVSFLENVYFLQEDFELPKETIKQYVKDYSVFYPSFDHKIFEDILLEFEMPIKSKIKDLSFGQKKKLHVSFALATKSKLLIMDEPTNGMDIPSKSKFRSIVSKNLGEEQLVIISTHQIRDLGQLLDNIVIIQDGKVLMNSNLYDLSTQYSCEFVSGDQVSEEALYAEAVPGGKMVLKANNNGEASDIDIEVLFNAVTTKQNLFTSKSTENGI